MSISIKLLMKEKILKIKYKDIKFGRNIKVLGCLPYFKKFKNSKCIIGDNVVINSDIKNSNTALMFRCKFVLGNKASIYIGNNTMLNGVTITSYKSIFIGSDCQIASGTLIADTDFHPVDPKERLLQVRRQTYDMKKVSKKEVEIGNNVWIGWNCTILKGTKIGDNSIVGAGSIVLGEFPSNVIIAGNPAKIVKQIK